MRCSLFKQKCFQLAFEVVVRKSQVRWQPVPQCGPFGWVLTVWLSDYLVILYLSNDISGSTIDLKLKLKLCMLVQYGGRLMPQLIINV